MATTRKRRFSDLQQGICINEEPPNKRIRTTNMQTMTNSYYNSEYQLQIKSHSKSSHHNAKQNEMNETQMNLCKNVQDQKASKNMVQSAIKPIPIKSDNYHREYKCRYI